MFYHYILGIMYVVLITLYDNNVYTYNTNYMTNTIIQQTVQQQLQYIEHSIVEHSRQISIENSKLAILSGIYTFILAGELAVLTFTLQAIRNFLNLLAVISDISILIDSSTDSICMLHIDKTIDLTNKLIDIHKRPIDNTLGSDASIILTAVISSTLTLINSVIAGIADIIAAYAFALVAYTGILGQHIAKNNLDRFIMAETYFNQRKILQQYYTSNNRQYNIDNAVLINIYGLWQSNSITQYKLFNRDITSYIQQYQLLQRFIPYITVHNVTYKLGLNDKTVITSTCHQQQDNVLINCVTQHSNINTIVYTTTNNQQIVNSFNVTLCYNNICNIHSLMYKQNETKLYDVTSAPVVVFNQLL